MTEVNRDYPWDLDAVVPLEADGGWGGVAAAGKVLKHEKKKQRKRFERPMFSNPYIIDNGIALFQKIVGKYVVLFSAYFCHSMQCNYATIGAEVGGLTIKNPPPRTVFTTPPP